MQFEPGNHGDAKIVPSAEIAGLLSILKVSN
jgi:hypothetical protein